MPGSAVPPRRPVMPPRRRNRALLPTLVILGVLLILVLVGVWFLIVIGIRREHQKLTGSEAIDKAA